MPERRYAFSWDFLGDIEAGRPHLGHETRIEVYRLFQYAMRDILEQMHGTEGCDKIMYQAGKLAGQEFCKHIVGKRESFDDFATAAQQALLDMKVGILRIETADMEKNCFTFAVGEDLDCSGLPDIDATVCNYDEGFLAGMLLEQTGKEFDVKEIDCWCTGDRTCRFDVKLKAATD